MKGLKRIGYAEALASATYGNYTTLVVPMLNLVVSLITPLAIAALPHLRECHLKKDNSGFVNISENTVRVVALFTVPCAFLFFLYPYTILDVLFTPIASVKGAAALSLLSPAVFLLSLLTLYNTFLEAKGMFYVPIISSAFGSVVKLIISFVFIDELGIIASPIGSSASYFVSLLISSMFFKDGLNRRLVRCFFYPLIISTLFILIPFYLVFYLEILPLYRNFELFYISAFSFLYFIFAILPIMRLKKSGLICKIEQK